MTAGSNYDKFGVWGRKTWYQQTLEKYRAAEERRVAAGYEPSRVEPFKLHKATQAQHDAIEDLANLLGYDNLQGFWQYLRGTEQTYYDILKLSSPE